MCWFSDKKKTMSIVRNMGWKHEWSDNHAGKVKTGWNFFKKLGPPPINGFGPSTHIHTHTHTHTHLALPRAHSLWNWSLSLFLIIHILLCLSLSCTLIFMLRKHNTDWGPDLWIAPKYKDNQACDHIQRTSYQAELGSTCPLCSKVSLLTPASGEGEYSIYFRVPSEEYGQLMLKRTELTSSFQGRNFKGNIWGESCRVHDFLLISWWWGNRVVLQES